MTNNPFADPEHLIDYGLRGKDVVERKVERKVTKPTEPVRSAPAGGVYELLPKTNTYALGVQTVRDAIAKGEHVLDRPLTFKENLEARLSDYKSNTGSDARLRLFNTWLDSCTGIAYKAGTTKFKIVPVCNELIIIDKDFNDTYLSVDYDSLQGTELDSSRAVYGGLLSQAQVLEHSAWLDAVEGDEALLKAYSDIVFKELDQAEAMGFYVRSNTDGDELRALFVSNLCNNSNADGDNDLDDNGRFVRKAQAIAPQAAKNLQRK